MEPPRLRAPGPAPVSRDRHARRGRAAVLILALLGSAIAAPSALADDTAPPPQGATRSCSEQYPADGPAGLDLQLGCVVADIVASYTGGSRPDKPARISAWLMPLGTFAAGILILVWLASVGRRRLNQRLAPADPASWWSCTSCRSLNAAQSVRCYACGAPRGPEAMMLPGRGPRAAEDNQGGPPRNG